MTAIHAFREDGTPSPGAQLALDRVARRADEAVDALASASVQAERVAGTLAPANLPAAQSTQLGGVTLSQVSSTAAQSAQTTASDMVSTDELFMSVTLPPGTMSTALTTLMIAPYALRITRIVASFDLLTLPASTANALTVTFRRYRGSGAVIVAKSSADDAITPRVPWRFDSLAWVESARQFAEGDMLNIGFTAAGSADITFPMTITIGYAPL